MKIIVVLPKDQHDYWNDLLKTFAFRTPHKVVNGGRERFHSVKNGMAACDKNGFIAVHDGVRPLVSKNTINQCFNQAEISKAVVPVIPANESIREGNFNENKAVDRSKYFMIQTPQVFEGNLLYKAYEQEFSNLFTDDASVVESIGQKITLIDGNPENIKITRPMDLKIAEVLLPIE